MDNQTAKLPKQQRSVAVLVAKQATYAERGTLLLWSTRLLEIRRANCPATRKAMEALCLTARYNVVWPVAKMIWREVKRHAWDERSIRSRMFLVGVGIGATVFEGQGAGIAALGTAIGVPLWVVLGAGGAFAGMLIEELSDKTRTKTTYTTIDAENNDEG